MDELQLASKKAIIEQVIVAIANGSTQKAACAEFGITPRTFQYAIKDFPELYNKVVMANRAILQTKYQQVIENRLEVIDAILEISSHPEALGLKALLSIEGKLKAIQQEMETKPEVNSNLPADGQALAKAAATYLANLPLLTKAGIAVMDGKIVE